MERSAARRESEARAARLKLDPRARIKGKPVFNGSRKVWEKAYFKVFGELLGLTHN